GGREESCAQPPDREDRLTYPFHEAFRISSGRCHERQRETSDVPLTDSACQRSPAATPTRYERLDSRSEVANPTRYRSGLMVKKKIAGAIDLRREIGGTAPIGVQLLHKPAMRLANLIASGVRSDAENGARFLEGHHSGPALSALPPRALGAPV